MREKDSDYKHRTTRGGPRPGSGKTLHVEDVQCFIHWSKIRLHKTGGEGWEKKQERTRVLDRVTGRGS